MKKVAFFPLSTSTDREHDLTLTADHLHTVSHSHKKQVTGTLTT